MTKIREGGSSPYIDDRRGSGGGHSGGIPGLGGSIGAGLPGLSGCGKSSLGVGGGGMAILLVLGALLLPKLFGGAGAATTAGATVPDQSQFDPSPVGAPEDAGGNPADPSQGGNVCDTETAQIVCGAVTDVNEFWAREFARAGKRYPVAKTVFYSGSTQTACGLGQAQTGPFYCPLDSLAYFDLDFLEQLQTQFEATGDLATQYIVAHEYGHHVQNVEGISDKVRELQQREPANANAYSVKLELQADCLAGIWAHDANERALLEPGDIDEALNAAAAVGDDRIQQETRGRVDPESFTHGSSAQRRTWFRRGYESGDSSECNTFAE